MTISSARRNFMQKYFHENIPHMRGMVQTTIMNNLHRFPLKWALQNIESINSSPPSATYYIYMRQWIGSALVQIIIREVLLHVKLGLYSSRRLSVAVAYSFVTRAGDHGCHRQLSSKGARVLCKYKQSPNRTAKWSIRGIQIQIRIQIQIQISSLTCIYNEK